MFLQSLIELLPHPIVHCSLGMPDMMESGTYFQEMRRRFHLAMVTLQTVGESIFLNLDPVQIGVDRISTRHHLYQALYSRVITFGNAYVDLVVCTM
jgi:hypothetical protein